MTGTTTATAIATILDGGTDMPDHYPIVDDLRRLVEAGSGAEEQESMAAAADVIEALSAELETVKGVSKTAMTHANERYCELDASFRRVVAENADLRSKLSAAEAKLAGGEAFNDAVDAPQFVKDDPAFTMLRYATKGFVLSALTHPVPTHNDVVSGDAS